MKHLVFKTVMNGPKLCCQCVHYSEPVGGGRLCSRPTIPDVVSGGVLAMEDYRPWSARWMRETDSACGYVARYWQKREDV